MSKGRRAVERLPCKLCGASGYDPCASRTTGKPMKSFHCPRSVQGRHDTLNAEVRKLDGMDEAFWMFAWLALGGTEHTYPPPRPALQAWQEIYSQHPDYDPNKQYWGEW